MSELYWGHHLEGCSLIDIRLPIFNTDHLHRSVCDSLISRCIRSCEDSMMNVRFHLLEGLMLSVQRLLGRIVEIKSIMRSLLYMYGGSHSVLCLA